MAETDRGQKVIIIKLGTELLKGRFRDRKEKLDQEVFNNIAEQTARLISGEFQVAIVSSAAIVAGMEYLTEMRYETKIFNKRQLAGIGAERLLFRWKKAFEPFSRPIAQVWLTHRDIIEGSAISSIHRYLQCGVVPIVNENDVVSDIEIELMDKKISENDMLTRLIAMQLKTDKVFLGTEVGGLFEKDPQIYPGARMYSEIDSRKVPNSLMHSDSTSENGKGGSKTKVGNAIIMHQAGMRVVVASHKNQAIVRFANGLPITGTLIGACNRLAKKSLDD